MGHRRTASSGSGATNLAHVKPLRDTLIPYFPPDEQLVRYVSPTRPLSHAQGRRMRLLARTPSKSQTMYESAHSPPPPGISDAVRDELIAALRTGNLTAEQTALLESSITALLSRPSASAVGTEPPRSSDNELAFPAPPPRSTELLRPENPLPDVPDTENEDEDEDEDPPRAASVPPPRPPRRSVRRHSRSINRLNVPSPIETVVHSDESGVESARDDRSDVDPAPPVSEVSEWEPDTPSVKTRFPDFMKRLNAKREKEKDKDKDT